MMFYLVLPAHILYLFFSDYGAPTVTTKLIIDKLMQVVFGCKAKKIKVILMLIVS